MYFTFTGGVQANYSDGGLWKAPLSGAAPTQLVSQWTGTSTVPIVGEISTDGTWVFYRTWENDGQSDWYIALNKVAVSGGTPTVLANLGQSGGDAWLPVNNTCVYAQGAAREITINKNPQARLFPSFLDTRATGPK